MKNNYIHAFLLGAVLIVLTTSAHAEFPAGLWKVSQFDFLDKHQINTVEYCLFSDRTIKGISTNVIPWQGHWKQSGTHVLLRLRYDDGNLVASYELNRISSKEMSGFGQSWELTDTSSGFFTYGNWQLIGNTCNPAR